MAKSTTITLVEGTKAIRDSKTKEYTTKATLSIKARHFEEKKNKEGKVTRKEMIVISSRGCSVVCTNGAQDKITLSKKVLNTAKYDDETKTFLEALDKAKNAALKKYLLNTMNLKNMNWSTLVAKCEPVQETEKTEAEAEALAKAC